MGLITDREAPRDIPSADSLRDLPDDLLGGPPPPAEIRLGQTVLMVLESPPDAGDYIDISGRLYIKHAGFDKNTPDSERVHVRNASIVAIWRKGDQMPEPKKTKAQIDAGAEAEAAENQPPLYGDDMEPSPEAAGASGLDEFDPAFSHGEVER